MTRGKFDVVVLGTGPSGSSIAKRCAAAGMSVAIVEKGQVGGVCALRGCNPKKVLVRAAELVRLATASEGRLGSFPNPHIDWGRLMEFKAEFTGPVPESVRGALQEQGVEIFLGAPEFESPSLLTVGDVGLQADAFVLATGSVPVPLDLPGADLVRTSDQFLELDEAPERSLFVGGGYISFEFAHVLAAAGKQVAIWERGEHPLDSFDPDLVQQLCDHSEDMGIEIHRERELVQVTQGKGGFEARNERGEAWHGDAVFHGAGRVPNLDGLRLDRAEVEVHRDGVSVDGYLRSTSNPRVLATGDCAASGHPALTPVAHAHAHAVVENLKSGQDRIEPDVKGVASVAFTVPPLAGVGLTQGEAEEKGVEHSVLSGDMASWGSVRKEPSRCAAYKLILGPDKEILGAHLLGPGAAETINLFSLAIRAGWTAADLKSAPLAFPTHGHDVRSMV